MKRRLLLLLSCFGLISALLLSGSLFLWKAKRQYALNRQLIAALVHHDSMQALALVNSGADPNTRYYPSPAPTLRQLLNQLQHPSSASIHDSPTAFQFACGTTWYSMSLLSGRSVNYPEDMSLIRAMLAHDADCKVKDEHDYTALHSAIVSNYPQTVQLLLEHGVNADEQDSASNTPLMLAVILAGPDITRLLLDHGVNVSVEDRRGNSALYYAVSYRKGASFISQLLAHGADPNQKNKNGDSPLFLAGTSRQPEIVALLRKGAN